MDYMDFYIAYDYGEADLELPIDKGTVFVLGKSYDPKQGKQKEKKTKEKQPWKLLHLICGMQTSEGGRVICKSLESNVIFYEFLSFI